MCVSQQTRSTQICCNKGLLDEFMKYFDTFVAKQMGKREKLIIVIDTNEYNTATSDIGSFMQEHDHIDTTRYPHGEFTPPSTYQRGHH